MKVVLLLIVAWGVMVVTHEAGHLIGGWVSGGTLKAADLTPWHLPYSIFEPDPQPLVTLWSGPLLGALTPLLVAALIRRESMWLIAWFCVFANGLYLAVAWITNDRWLDTRQLLDHGAHPASIACYCITTLLTGYAGLRRTCRRLLSTPAA